jgi:hypothetical protein
MRLFAATFILSLFLGAAALAGGGPEQQMAQVVVVQPEPDHTAIYVGAVATVLAAGIGYLGVRRSRKG